MYGVNEHYKKSNDVTIKQIFKSMMTLDNTVTPNNERNKHTKRRRENAESYIFCHDDRFRSSIVRTKRPTNDEPRA